MTFKFEFGNQPQGAGEMLFRGKQTKYDYEWSKNDLGFRFRLYPEGAVNEAGEPYGLEVMYTRDTDEWDDEVSFETATFLLNNPEDGELVEPGNEYLTDDEYAAIKACMKPLVYDTMNKEVSCIVDQMIEHDEEMDEDFEIPDPWTECIIPNMTLDTAERAGYWVDESDEETNMIFCMDETKAKTVAEFLNTFILGNVTVVPQEPNDKIAKPFWAICRNL